MHTVDVQDVREKLYFYIICFNPSLTYISLQDIFKARNAVQFLLNTQYVIMYVCLSKENNAEEKYGEHL